MIPTRASPTRNRGSNGRACKALQDTVPVALVGKSLSVKPCKPLGGLDDPPLDEARRIAADIAKLPMRRD